MTTRYRLPLYANAINLGSGRLDASPDGWFYPRSAAEEQALKDAGCVGDDLDKRGLPPPVVLDPDWGLTARGVPLLGNSPKSLFRQPVPRMKTLALAADHTTLRQVELECEFSALRFWIPNLSASTIPNVRLTVGQQSQIYANNSSNNLNVIAPDFYLNATFGGSITGTLAANYGTEVPSWTATDWIGMESAQRTDGGTRPIVQFRIEVPVASGTITIPYATMGAWDTGSSETRGRIDRAYVQSVLGCTTQGSFTTTTLDGTNFIPVMIEYMPKNVTGKQVVGNGDSIPSGLGGSSFFGFIHRAVYRNSTPQAPIEFVNCALHSQIPSTYVPYLEYITTILNPDVTIIQPWTINAVSTDVTTGVNRGSRAALARQLAALRKVRSAAIIMNASPAGTGFKTFTNDSRRIAFNSDIPILAPGVPILDVSSIISSGTVDGVTGQMMPKNPLYTTDDVHYINAGHDAVADVLWPLMSPFLYKG